MSDNREAQCARVCQRLVVFRERKKPMLQAKVSVTPRIIVVRAITSLTSTTLVLGVTLTSKC